MNSGIENPGVKGLLSELLESRREKFRYVDKTKQGSFSRSAIPTFLLNTLGSCLSIPVLFFVSFHAFRVYSTYGVDLESFLSVLFFGVMISIFFDLFVGYFYDRLVKIGLPTVKTAFTVIGTIGLILSMGFLFRHDADLIYAVSQWRWTIIGLTLSYTLANTTSFKNTANFTPSQYNRSVLLFAEYAIKGFFIFAYVCFPYWIKFFTSACSCGDSCSNDADGVSCLSCLNSCDTFSSSKIFRDVSLAFTGLFGLCNIIVQFTVEPRVDEDHEEISTTFNRRIIEIFRNGLLVKTFFITLVQSIVFFGFAFWLNHFMDNRTTANPSCTDFWGSASYFCTKSWMKQFALILAFVVALIIYLISLKKKVSRGVSKYLPFVLIPAGILLIVIDFEQGLMYFFIALITAFFYPTLAANKLYYIDGTFYDEYLSGNTQAHLPGALFHLATKIGFFLSFALHISLLDNVTSYDQLTNADSDGLGGFFIFAAFVLFALNYSLSKYDIHAFDKVQVAIERNNTNIVQTLSFYDPIERETIKRPILSTNNLEKPVITLLYNLSPKGDLKLAVSGQYKELKSDAVVRLILFIVLLIVFIVLTIIFGGYLNTRWGWFILIGLIIIPVSFYGALYNYNVHATASILESNKYNPNETSVISRFEPLLKDRSYTS